MVLQNVALAAGQGNGSGLGIVLAVLIGAVVLGYLALIVTAFFGALLSPLPGGMKVVWAVFIWCAPFIGALCWYFIGRRNAFENAV